MVQFRTQPCRQTAPTGPCNHVRRSNHHNRKLGRQNSATECQSPRCATRYPVPCFPGHCADSIQSSNAELHHNGPALPGDPATAHCNLHVGLLPPNASLVSQVLSEFPHSTGFADGLFVMTTATDHKNNLNRSTLKKDYARTLRVETIANSAGGTAAVAMVAQPSTGFLNVRYQPDGSPTEDTEDCPGRIIVGLTRSKSLTLVVSPLDMMGLIGMAQVLAALAYGVQGLRRGFTTWDWPSFNPNPARENNRQIERWSLNEAPSWVYPPLAIAQPIP